LKFIMRCHRFTFRTAPYPFISSAKVFK
jgi:hypothetical protein